MVACSLTSSLTSDDLLQYLCLELPTGDDDDDESETAPLLQGTITGTGGVDVESGRKKLFAGFVRGRGGRAGGRAAG